MGKSDSFGAKTTTDEVLAGIDLSGQTILVTGSSGGLGLETSRALAAHGASVIMAARNHEKNAEAIDQIKAAHPEADLEPVELDLGDLASVRNAAQAVADSHPDLSALIANAGVMATPFGRTADGFETQFGINHLGHFLLSNLLAPQLIAGAPSRVVFLSSGGHTMGQMNFEDPNYENRPYDEFDAYGQSKTANILCAVGLDARLAAQGVRSFAVHPGGIHTELGRYFTADVMERLTARISEGAETSGGSFEWKSIPAGAATSVWAATSPDLGDKGGLYLEDCGIGLPRDEAGTGTGSGVMGYAVDPEGAERLWTLSESLVGENFSY